MRYSIIVPALFAASSIAAPAVKYITHVDVVQITVTAGTPEASAAANPGSYAVAAAPKPAPVHKSHQHKNPHHHHHSAAPAAAAPAPVVSYAAAPAPAAPAPVVTYAPSPAPPAAPKPAPSYKPAPAPASSPAAKPSSTPSSSSNDGAPKSGGVSVLETFNKWRSAYNLPTAKWSPSLAANAFATGKGGNGVTQTHILPTLTKAGSCAQVITPGADEAITGYGEHTPFEIALLSWLCEKSTDSQIAALCPAVVKANGMKFIDTAHHDDLVNPEYTQVGIAFYPNPSPDVNTPWRGLWVASLESA